MEKNRNCPVCRTKFGTDGSENHDSDEMNEFDFRFPAMNPVLIGRFARQIGRNLRRNVRRRMYDVEPNFLDINNAQILVLEQQTHQILENLNRMTEHLEQNRHLFQRAIRNLRFERNMEL